MKEEKDKKQGYYFWLKPGTSEMITAHVDAADTRSRSQFVDAAIRHYCCVLDAESNKDLLSDEVLRVVKASVKDSENHIARAFELGKELNDTNIDDDKADKGNSTNNTIPYNKPTNTAASSIAKVKVITAVSRLGKDISNIFRQEFDGYANDPTLHVDSKLRREIEAKKKGQNISM